MIDYNFHAHTTFSDGKNSPEEMIEAAIAKGFECFGISDHALTTFHPNWSIPEHRIAEYVGTLQALKRKYEGKIRFYVGLENDALAVAPPDGLDYIIGSVHWLKKGERYIEMDHSQQILRDAVRDLYGGEPDALAEEYFELVASFSDDPTVSFIGHFDLITKFDERNEPLFSPTPRYTAAWQRAALRLIEAGKIFEINTGAISRGYRTVPYPAPDILQFWGEHGAKVIVSSDCHSVAGIDCAFDRAEELALRYGCNLVKLF